MRIFDLIQQQIQQNTEYIRQASAAMVAKQEAGHLTEEEYNTIQAFEGQTAGLIHFSNALSSHDHREQITRSDLLTALREACQEHSIDLDSLSSLPPATFFEQMAESVAAILNAQLFESAVCECGRTTQVIQGFFGDVRNHIEDCPQCGEHTFHTGEDHGKCLSCGYWSGNSDGMVEQGNWKTGERHVLRDPEQEMLAALERAEETHYLDE